MDNLNASYMNPLRDTTGRVVRGRLLQAGITIGEFAARHGIPETTVRSVIRRYAGQNREPRGMRTYSVLRKLGEAINSAC